METVALSLASAPPEEVRAVCRDYPEDLQGAAASSEDTLIFKGDLKGFNTFSSQRIPLLQREARLLGRIGCILHVAWNVQQQSELQERRDEC